MKNLDNSWKPEGEEYSKPQNSLTILYLAIVKRIYILQKPNTTVDRYST